MTLPTEEILSTTSILNETTKMTFLHIYTWVTFQFDRIVKFQSNVSLNVSFTLHFVSHSRNVFMQHLNPLRYYACRQIWHLFGPFEILFFFFPQSVFIILPSEMLIVKLFEKTEQILLIWFPWQNKQITFNSLIQEFLSYQINLLFHNQSGLSSCQTN